MHIMLDSGIYTLAMYTNADMCEHASWTKSNKRQSFTTHIKIGELCVCMSKYEKNVWSLIHLTNIKQNVWEKEIRIIYVNEKGNIQQSLYYIFCVFVLGMTNIEPRCKRNWRSIFGFADLIILLPCISIFIWCKWMI